MSLIVRRCARRLLRPTVSARSYATPATLKERNAAELDPQISDYPRLPWIKKQTLPAKGWWDPQMRRNFGDTYHEQEEMLSMWGPDAIPSDIPPKLALRWFSIAVLSFVSFGVIIKVALVPDRTAVAREYPFSGLITELGGLEENKARIADEDE